MQHFDAIVVGGGPAGATAAQQLAEGGKSVLLLDKDGRIKPCGGAIPPRLIRDFDVPDHLLAARIRSARMVSPSSRAVDMPIESGFVGMVDRDVFDEWLRERARAAGACRVKGTLMDLQRGDDGTVQLTYRPKAGSDGESPVTVRTQTVVGADGANSTVARLAFTDVERIPLVFAYHEIVAAPEGASAGYGPDRCDVHYNGDLSPDFYAWVFPHGPVASVGVGSAQKGFSLRDSVARLRAQTGLADWRTLRREGAPIPLRPRKRWDDGRNVILAGDAAGVVAPASGEGIYYAMVGGRLAGQAALRHLAGERRALSEPRRQFMSEHGRVFWVLGMLQYFFYCNDRRRERFVSMCQDKDVQSLTWDAYMNKQMVRSRPMAHMRVLMKDIAQLTGFSPVAR